MKFVKDDITNQKRVWTGIPYEVLASNSGRCTWCEEAKLDEDHLGQFGDLGQGWTCFLSETPVMSDWCTKFQEGICPLPEEAKNAGRY